MTQPLAINDTILQSRFFMETTDYHVPTMLHQAVEIVSPMQGG